MIGGADENKASIWQAGDAISSHKISPKILFCPSWSAQPNLWTGQIVVVVDKTEDSNAHI